MSISSMHERVGLRATTLYQRVLYILGGGATRRFHTFTTIKDVTVGHHSYTVAWLCYLLTEKPSLNLIMAALAHDTAEQVTGDVPSPTKRLLGAQGQYMELESKLLHDNMANFVLTHDEENVLQLADKMAGMLECAHERNMGNKYVELCYQRWKGYIDNQTLADHELIIYAVVQQIWKEAIS